MNHKVFFSKAVQVSSVGGLRMGPSEAIKFSAILDSVPVVTHPLAGGHPEMALPLAIKSVRVL